MEKFILDYSTWRCGNFGKNKLGKGDTYLLNAEGYMCCAGQMELQLHPELPKKDILDFPTPSTLPSTKVTEDILVKAIVGSSSYNDRINTDLCRSMININDATNTTPEEKINALAELLSKENITIEVINKP